MEPAEELREAGPRAALHAPAAPRTAVAPPATTWPGGAEVRLSPARVTGLLTVVAGSLLGIYFVLLYLRYGLGHEHVLGLVERFDVLKEGNFPSWYSSVSLLFCAVLLALIAVARRRAGDRLAPYWVGLALVFAYLALDEGAAVHEMIQQNLRRGIDRERALNHRLTMAFPLLLATGVAVVYARFLAAIPRRTAALFVLAGALFVAGGVAVDQVGDTYWIVHGAHDLKYSVLNGIEELLEMTGVIVFVFALLTYMESHVGRIQLSIASRESGTRRGPG